MTIAPTIGWVNVNAPGYFGFHSVDGGPGDLGNATINIPAGTTVYFNAGTKGEVSFSVTGNLDDSDTAVNTVSDMSLIVAGQTIECSYIPSTPHCIWPPVISATYPDSSTFEYSNGIFDEDENTFIRNQPPLHVVNDATITVLDFAPIGELAAVVSPGTGVTLADQNSDGTGNVSNIGNGLAIMNLMGQGEGGFTVKFADSGDYTVTCAFTTGDPSYDNITLAPVVNIVVT